MKIGTILGVLGAAVAAVAVAVSAPPARMAEFEPAVDAPTATTGEQAVAPDLGGDG